MFSDNILFAFGLTLFAGLSTGIGSLMAFFTKRTNTKFLAVSLGFSAGVMIYVSFAEILPKAKDSLIFQLGADVGAWAAVAAFFSGIFIIAIIDKLIPTFENPHEIRRVEEINAPDAANQKLLRMGFMSAFAIGIHNFPEGIATFTAALTDPALGISIAIAIAIHNIPEGIAVSIPIFYATGDRKKAFLLSFSSGLAEPVGALLGWIIFLQFTNDLFFGLIFASSAGIMVFISLDELLPTAREFGEHHLSVYGLIGGMIVMALSLIILN